MAELEWHVCPSCGIEYGAPAAFFSGKRRTKDTFYCPNGHSLSYKKSESDKLAEQLSQARQQLAQKDDQIRKERDRAYQMTETLAFRERQLATTKGVVTKLKNRVSHGVCPCCNRTFQDLSRHMQTKHPRYRAEEAPSDGAAKH